METLLVRENDRAVAPGAAVAAVICGGRVPYRSTLGLLPGVRPQDEGAAAHQAEGADQKDGNPLQDHQTKRLFRPLLLRHRVSPFRSGFRANVVRQLCRIFYRVLAQRRPKNRKE